MYPTISHLIEDLTGYHIPFPVPTFFFFLIVACISASLVLSLELRRKGEKHHLRGYHNAKGKYMRPEQRSGAIMLIAILSGLAGAKLFSLLENPAGFSEAPLFVLLAPRDFIFSGGLIAGLVAVIVYAKTTGLRVAHLLDASAPPLALAYAIGRIGCYLSGDWVCGIDNDLAKPTWLQFLPDWLWAYHFPEADHHAAIASAAFNPVFPTQLYEALVCGLLFCALWIARKKIAVPGILFSLFLLSYGAERFLMEKIRTGLGFSLMNTTIKQAELIACFLVITGCLLFYAFLRKHKQKLTHYHTFLK